MDYFISIDDFFDVEQYDVFFDRMLLAKSSLDCLNACTNSGILAAALQFGFISIANIAEVFVGQYNGAGRKDKLGEPVWQMIWLSVFTSLVFIPVGAFAGPWIFRDTAYSSLEIEYFRWVMYYSPCFCLASALTTFYIGRERCGSSPLLLCWPILLMFYWTCF